MSRDEFLNSLLGRPWVANATGPDAFDCWHLCVHIHKHLFNRHLPLISVPQNPSWPWMIAQFRNNPERQNWHEVCRWEPGKLVKASDSAIVLMSRLNRPAHAGVWLVPENRVMHADCSMGVCFEQISQLHAGGWTRLIFLEHDQNVPLDRPLKTD